MKEFWNTIQFAFAAIGGWLGWFLGGCDGLLIALILFAVTDYITGFMCAVADKKLSSAVGFKGICRKVLIFIMVGIANILDVQVIGMPAPSCARQSSFSTSRMKAVSCGEQPRTSACRFRTS
jgi:phage-related holin